MKAIRALIADDHALVRAGIRALVEKIDDVSVIAETGAGGEALRLIEELKPDVVLLDVTMPGLSGLEVLAESRKHLPNVRGVILTVHDGAEYAVQALRAERAGFLPTGGAG